MAILLVIVCSSSLVLFLIWVLSGISRPINLIDSPSGRKRHSDHVPTVGGLAIFLTAMVISLFLELTDTVRWVLLVAGLIVFTGVIDDIRGLNARVRLFAQLVACVTVIGMTGLVIEQITFGAMFNYKVPWILGFGITCFAVVGLTNSFNLIDGIDGLAAGYAITAIVITGLSYYLSGIKVEEYEWLLLLFSSVFAFWLVNISALPLNKIFLGDAGSMLLGFLIGWVLIYSHLELGAMSMTSVLWVVALPVWDTFAVALTRLIDKKSPFTADRRHLHYVLSDYFIGPKKTLWLLVSVSMILSVFGLVTSRAGAELLSFSVYVACFVIYLCASVYLANKYEDLSVLQ